MRLNLEPIIKLISDMGLRWSQLPNDMKQDILQTITEKIAENVKKEASQGGMLQGEYNRGEVANSVRFEYLGKDEFEIYFDGLSSHKSDKGKNVRLAEIAFLNEYGVPSKQAKRKFISRSIDAGLRQTYDYVEKVVSDWVERDLINSL